MEQSYDIVIIGAGPSGMSAAITASTSGAHVLVLDSKTAPGGQIYRSVNQSPLQDTTPLGHDYQQGRVLVEQFLHCPAEKRQKATVWHIGVDGEILFSQAGETHRVTTREIMIGCGAMERPFPIPGWQQPGVMTAGSAQVMLKSDALVHANAVFAGQGPLLYLIVAQYLRYGIPIKAVVDTTPHAHYRQAMKHVPDALNDIKTLFKGMGLLYEIRRANIPYYANASDLAIDLDPTAPTRTLRFGTKQQQHQIESEHIFLHHGVIPNLNMTQSLGLAHQWSDEQSCWQPQVNAWYQSSVDNIAVIGDACAIIGAENAQLSGHIAALQQLYRLQLIDQTTRDQRASNAQQKQKKIKRFRRFIDILYRPPITQRIPEQDDVVVCRCEAQTVAQLKSGFEQGANTPNTLKSLTRCGMGPCQGRQCGHTVSELLTTWRGHATPASIGYYRLRSPTQLLPLEELSRYTPSGPTPTQFTSGLSK